MGLVGVCGVCLCLFVYGDAVVRLLHNLDVEYNRPASPNIDTLYKRIEMSDCNLVTKLHFNGEFPDNIRNYTAFSQRQLLALVATSIGTLHAKTIPIITTEIKGFRSL